MKFLLEVSSIEQIKNNLDKVDGFILGCDTFTSFSAHYFTYDEIASARLVTPNIYLNLNEMLHNSQMEDFKEVIKKYSSLDVHFIVQDFGACLLIKDICGLNKTIFNPITLITNSEDAKVYSDIGFEAVICSSEITCEDVVKISSKVNNVGCVGFGYHPMYQTYRHIIDLYKESNNLNFNKNENMFLREWTRDKKYHVIDNHAGSVVFRPYVINMLKEYESLNQNVEFLIVNTIFFNNDEFNVLVDTINKLQNSNISLEDANEILENNFNIEDGFIYLDSVYNPKEF